MTIACFPPPPGREGFGIVLWTATQGIYCLTGRKMSAPLSGQRALRREIFDALRFYPRRFGLEVGITVQLLRAGYRLQEVPLPMTHRHLGRSWHGFVHRGRELKDIVWTLWQLYRHIGMAGGRHS